MFENAKCRTNNGIAKITIATLKLLFMSDNKTQHFAFHDLLLHVEDQVVMQHRLHVKFFRYKFSHNFLRFKINISIMLVFVDTFEIFQGYGHTFVFNYLCYHGNMYPPKHPSTCRGSPTFRARWEISSIGSIMPWQNWGAEAHSRIVFGVMACQI